MPSASRVLAICVNYDGGQVLEETLRSLLAQSYPSLRVLVVDNASSDDSWKLVEAPVELMRLPTNRGYAAALNAAVSSHLGDAEGPEYFLLLNNDLSAESDLVDKLIQCARAHGADVCGPAVLDRSNPPRLEAGWGRVDWSHVLADFQGKGASPQPPYDRSRDVELLLGCALLVHRRVFEEVGLFDEDFFMYHEEVDFLYRCRQSGFQTRYCPQARVHHRAGHSWRKTPLRKTYWLRRNSVLFLRKHGASSRQWAYWGLTASAGLAFNLFALRWRRAGAILRGTRDGLRAVRTPSDQRQAPP